MAEVTQNIESQSFLTRPFHGLVQILRSLGTFLSRAATQIPIPLWMIFDATVAVAAILAAYQLSPEVGKQKVTTFELIVFPLSVLVAGLSSGLYEKQFSRSLTRLIGIQVLMAFLAGILFSLSVTVVLFGLVGRWIVAIAVFLSFFGSLLPRFLLLLILKQYPIRVLLVTRETGESKLSQQLEAESSLYDYVGLCSPGNEASRRFLGTIEEVEKICRDHQVDVIVIRGDISSQTDILKPCFGTLKMGCMLMDECTFYEEVFQQVLVDYIDDSWFFTSKINMSRRFGVVVKRIFDIILSIVGLILFAPLFPFIWLLIRLTSWGPALYIQERCGQYGQIFRMYKFRTMVVNAETAGEEWAQLPDPRVTPFGYLLRKTRLDEIPQLINVLKGDMSFIGPRPERPGMHRKIEQEIPYFFFRLWARPGLTGLAQLRSGYGASIEDAKEKLQYDLYYIKNWSLFLDLQILFRTLLVLMKGAR